MKRYVFYSSIIFVLLVFSYCKKTIQGEKEFRMNQIIGNYDSLINRVEIKGDTNAYDELFYGFMDSNKSGRTDSVLRYSRIMADNFKYERAYFDHLRALCEKYEIENTWSNLSELNLMKVDEASKSVVVSWLNKMLQNKIITQAEFNSVKK